MPPSEEKRLLPIDGLRGIAILLVMQYHFWGLPFGLFNRHPERAADRFASDVVQIGWVGVDLFFVLSGFLITGILLDVKGRNGYFRNFFARRALRIMPPYYIFLLFVIVVIPLVPAFHDGLAVVALPERLREDQLWFWTYLINVATSLDAVDVNPPTVHLHFWTLAVEEQFYLLWPLVVLVFRPRALTAVCVAMVLGAFVFRIAILEGMAAGVFNNNAATVLMPAKMDALALGALVAIGMREGWLSELAPYAPAAALVAGGGVIVLMIMNSGLELGDADAVRWGYTMVAVFFTAALVMTLGQHEASPIVRILTLPPLLAIGRVSYTMYIVHLLVSFELARQVAVNDWWRTVDGSQIPFNIAFSLVATGVTFVIAFASWHVLEQPLLVLKRHFVYGTAPSRTVPATVTGEAQ